jgi:hypothetical protein
LPDFSSPRFAGCIIVGRCIVASAGHAPSTCLGPTSIPAWTDCGGAEIDVSAEKAAEYRANGDLEVTVGVDRHHTAMRDVIIGSEAVAHGSLTKSDLRRRHRAIFRDVYIPKHHEASLRDRTAGAWLWSRRRAIVAGVAASALHGAQWVDAKAAIELISANARPQPGLVVRNETLADDEITHVARLPVTSPTRTAYDLGRHLPRGQAIARLDALMHATPFSVEDVLLLTKRHPGARGLRRLRTALALVDGGAASPKETWLRLLLIAAGLPAPATQIPVVDGHRPAVFLDMGWEEFKVAAEHDGDQHRSDRRQYVKDMRRHEAIDDLGWRVVRVVCEDRPRDVIDRVYKALWRRGYRRDRH